MLNDPTIQADVERELRWEPSIHAEQIGVSARNGVVELDGHVGSYYEKWSAERAALRVVGVRGVASEIKVDLPDEESRTDEDIARTAMEHLRWNLLVPETIKVRVTDGAVTLSGTVDRQYQSDEAEQVVRPLRGVKFVMNEIDVRPTVNNSVIKSDVEDALKRHAAIDARQITVETSGNMLVLRGRVRSWSERAEAERAAWGAPGVEVVENYITVR